MEEREKKEVVHLMVDIETLGKEPGCVVLSYSVKKFDPFGVKYTEVVTEAVVDVFSSLMMGLKVDEDTVNWWKCQKDALLSMNAAQMNEKKDARDAAFQLYDVLSYMQEHYDVKLWGRGIGSFDLPILDEFMRRAYTNYALEVTGKEMKYTTPWKYYQVMDVRTLYNACRMAGMETEKHPTPHTASEDVDKQIKEVKECFYFMGKHEDI